MQLTHEFTVPASVEETWEALGDIESVGNCFPGATVQSVEGGTFSGTVKIKLGPIAMVYNGTGTFVEKDESSHTMKVEAKGKDKRGNGTAGADVVVTLADTDAGTSVNVVTDLAITGKPAQFGRGVMQDVSDKLLGKFVDCLQTKVGPQAAPEAEPVAADTDSAASAAATPGAPAQQPAPTEAGFAAATPPQSAPQPRTADDDALDLGAAVLPVLVRTYGKQVAAGFGVLLVLLVIRRLLR